MDVEAESVYPDLRYILEKKRGPLRDPLDEQFQRVLLAAVPVLVVIRIALVGVIIAIALRVSVHVLLLSICLG